MGCNRLLDVESNILVMHLINHCAGDPKLSDIGVFLYYRMAKYGSCFPECALL